MGDSESGLDIPPPRTPAGWYPDGTADQLRWWDGERWTARTRTAAEAEAEAATADPAPPVAIRGVTGYAELAGAVLRYRKGASGPALLEIDLRTVASLALSTSGDVFEPVLVGARARTRPGLFSETSLRRGPRTPRSEWESFVRRLDDAIRAAVPKAR